MRGKSIKRYIVDIVNEETGEWDNPVGDYIIANNIPEAIDFFLQWWLDTTGEEFPKEMRKRIRLWREVTDIDWI